MDRQERLLTAFFCSWQRVPTEEEFFLPKGPRGICWSHLEG